MIRGLPSSLVVRLFALFVCYTRMCVRLLDCTKPRIPVAQSIPFFTSNHVPLLFSPFCGCSPAVAVPQSSRRVGCPGAEGCCGLPERRWKLRSRNVRGRRHGQRPLRHVRHVRSAVILGAGSRCQRARRVGAGQLRRAIPLGLREEAVRRRPVRMRGASDCIPQKKRKQK